MAEDKMMRLSQVARILNVGITTIVDHLSAKGYKVESNPNTKINSDQIEFLAKDFKSDDLKTSLVPKQASVEVSSEQKEEKVKSDNDEILYFRNTPSQSEQEKPSEDPKPDPVTAIHENRLPGIKVVGKIDLDARKPAPAQAPAPIPAPAPEELAKSEAAAPIIEEPKPVVEDIIVASKEDTKPVETAPLNVKVFEQPVAKPEVEKKAEDIKEEVSVKVVPVKEESQPPVVASEPVVVSEKAEEQITVKESVPPTAPDEKSAPDAISGETQEGELIEARGEQLRGLRVVGKIELPSDKFKKKDPVASTSDTAADKKRRRKRKRIRDGVTGATDTKPAATPNNTAGDSSSPTRSKDANSPATGNKPSNRLATGTAGNAGSGTSGSTTSNANAKGGNNRTGNNRRGGKREEVSDKEVSDNIRATMARMGGGSNSKAGAKGRGLRRRDRADQNDPNALDDSETKVLRVTEFVSANDLASLMDVTVQEVISVCMSMGMFVSINQRLDAEAITFITDEFGFEVAFISAEEEVQNDVVEEVDSEESLVERAPIVTIMGHVDHGKTSLLDYIRKENVASGEAGGITQHIGAYSVKTKVGKQVTFLDTPGHEAFTAMRARGAKVTDVVIIVIAADDSIMPQTREAINHAQVAGVPIVFAFSKVDKPGANTEKIREELANMNLLVEEWGGKYQTQEISSKTGLGIDELLEKVLLEAELLELKANPNRRANGTVVEASLDKGRGYVTTLLVETGTLKLGDVVLAGAHFGKVKAMTDYLGRKLKTAGPSMPVQLLGLNGAPQAGDRFNVFENERDAREIAVKREQIQREQTIRTRKHITLEEIGRRKAIGSFRELNLIVKGDVDGSVEALSDSLLQLSTSEVQVNIIHKGVGQISESDVNLAIASDAIVIGFQVRPSANAKKWPNRIKSKFVTTL